MNAYSEAELLDADSGEAQPADSDSDTDEGDDRDGASSDHGASS